MINDFLDNLAAHQHQKIQEPCIGCGCKCPTDCECYDCDDCSCASL